MLVLDLIEKLLNPNPKERISLEQISKHPWYTGEAVSKAEYKKEMEGRVKKVMVKIRKEQESEIKATYISEKTKREHSKFEEIPICIKREYEDRIFELRHMLSQIDVSQSSDSSSSNDHLEEGREEEFNQQRQNLGEVKISKKKSEERERER